MSKTRPLDYNIYYIIFYLHIQCLKLKSIFKNQPVKLKRSNKKDLRFSRKSLTVDLVQKNVHHIVKEANRWRTIIGVEYNKDKLAKNNNSSKYIR